MSKDEVLLFKKSATVLPKRFVKAEMDKAVAAVEGDEALIFTITPIREGVELQATLDALAVACACKECNGVNLLKDPTANLGSENVAQVKQ